ncbi:MAG TPA: L-serine ammonia-lyase, iron-sulfur-dependent, subunit alpha [Anaerolineaceae bacterium]|nr:L-serine ammonia-lyase, iron-sulfur-dependent, subunit alpha [Anaerolineaceae bacterium]
MYRKIEDLVQQAETAQVPISEIVLRSEIEQNASARAEVLAQMHQRLEVMRTSAQAGLETPVYSRSGLTRGSAHRFWNWLASGARPVTGELLSRAVARALSTAEVNAGMGCIVATPTAGSAGILPAVLVTLQEGYALSDDALVAALFTAAGIGMVIATRAQIAGAAGGCQAETGSAAAMAAGAVVELLGGSPRQSAQAVAIALKNMLGLVCDPVAGMVEVPCVKRNAAGVGQCFVAVDLALAGVESLIPADEVIDSMGRIGAHMDERLRETALGGLAATPTGKALAQEIWSRKP